ncbi:MAG: sigma-70 family RNA polymerase sigma factor [Myxococcota bacterium]
MDAAVTTTFLEQTIHPEETPPAELEARLQAAVAAGREAWPGVALSPADFAAHLGSVISDETELLDALDEVRVEDLFLACACGRGDPVALRHFEREVMPRAAAAVARVDGQPQFVDDVCADLRVRLLVADGRTPDIMSYIGRGPLRHWVQVAAMRAATSRKRKRRREVPMDLPDVVDSLLTLDPELAPFADQLKVPFAEVFSRALKTLSSRERNVLRMYLIDGVSAEGIGKMYRVHRATVARWITKARQKVHRETRVGLAAAVDLKAGSFESVVGMMWHGMDLSLATFLEEASTAPPHRES